MCHIESTSTDGHTKMLMLIFIPTPPPPPPKSVLFADKRELTLGEAMSRFLATIRN